MLLLCVPACAQIALPTSIAAPSQAQCDKKARRNEFELQKFKCKVCNVDYARSIIELIIRALKETRARLDESANASSRQAFNDYMIVYNTTLAILEEMGHRILPPGSDTARSFATRKITLDPRRSESIQQIEQYATQILKAAKSRKFQSWQITSCYLANDLQSAREVPLIIFSDAAVEMETTCRDFVAAPTIDLLYFGTLESIINTFNLHCIDEVLAIKTNVQKFNNNTELCSLNELTWPNLTRHFGCSGDAESIKEYVEADIAKIRAQLDKVLRLLAERQKLLRQVVDACSLVLRNLAEVKR
jgi:hypothetical protein